MFPKLKVMKKAYEASMANKKETETTTMAPTEFNLPIYHIAVLKRRVIAHALLDLLKFDTTTFKPPVHKWIQSFYLPIG